MHPRYPQTQPPSTTTTRAFCQIPRDSHHSRQINRGHGGKGIEDTYGDNPTGYFIKQCETWKCYLKVRVSILVQGRSMDSSLASWEPKNF